MAGVSAAEDGGTITTAVRNKHTSNPIIHFIFFICNPCLSAVFAVIPITVTVFCIVTTVVIMAVTVVVTTWTPNQSHCNDQHYNH